MKVSIIGSGYVGLITGAGLASKGHEVTCIDIDEKKVKSINEGKPPIHEEGLEELLKKVLKEGKFKASTDLKSSILNSEVSFICVGTPSNEYGSIDLKYVKQVAEDIGKALKEKKDFHVVIVKSTVVPGTTESKVIPLLEENSGKKAGKDFGVCANPEFLREGKALEDFNNPARVVLGCTDKKTMDIVKELLKADCPIIETNPSTAEMIKYASNSFLATKISFINEIGNICKKLNINAYEVAKALGLDPRISPKFLNAGLGFGGSCLPKDTKALVASAKELGYNADLIKAVIDLNETQPERILYLAEKKLSGFDGKTITVLGLAFKPGTDDMREAPSIKIINSLLEKKAKVKAYDPKALENAKQIFGDKVKLCNTIEEALEDSELCLIVTDWPEFKNLDFHAMKTKIVIDGRNILENREGIDYEGLCW